MKTALILSIELNISFVWLIVGLIMTMGFKHRNQSIIIQLLQGGPLVVAIYLLDFYLQRSIIRENKKDKYGCRKE